MQRSDAVELFAVPGIPLVRKDDDPVAQATAYSFIALGT